MPSNVKLLLKESIKNVGKVGDIVEVSPGYARNYLLPKDLAVQPTPNNVKKVEARRKEIEKQERDRREQQEAMIGRLTGIEITLEHGPTSRATCWFGHGNRYRQGAADPGLQRQPRRCQPARQA